MATGKEKAGSSEIQKWIEKFKLSKLRPRIEEEEITLQFLIAESEEKNKFIFAVAELKKVKSSAKSNSNQDESKEDTQHMPSNLIINDASLQSLIAMGFDRNKSIIALLSQGNDVMKAIEVLTEAEEKKKGDTVWDEDRGMGKYLRINGKLLDVDVNNAEVKWDVFKCAYLQQTIESNKIGVHRFKFNLKHVDKPYSFDASPYGLYIGVAQEKIQSVTNLMNKEYLFNGWNGKMCTLNETKQYGKDCVSGDVLEMIVDTRMYTLSYLINGKDYGVMCKISGSKWRAFVAFHNPRHKIEFVSYTFTPKK